MKVKNATIYVPGEILEIKNLLAREADEAKIFGSGVEHLARRGKAPAGKERDEAIMNSAGGRPGELLKDDRTAKRRKALAAQCDLDWSDGLDYLRQNRVGATQMRHRFARVRDLAIRHRANYNASADDAALSLVIPSYCENSTLAVVIIAKICSFNTGRCA